MLYFLELRSSPPFATVCPYTSPPPPPGSHSSRDLIFGVCDGVVFVWFPRLLLWCVVSFFADLFGCGFSIFTPSPTLYRSWLGSIAWMTEVRVRECWTQRLIICHVAYIIIIIVWHIRHAGMCCVFFSGVSVPPPQFFPNIVLEWYLSENYNFCQFVYYLNPNLLNFIYFGSRLEWEAWVCKKNWNPCFDRCDECERGY